MSNLSNEQLETLIPEFDKFDDKRMANALRELLAYRESDQLTQIKHLEADNKDLNIIIGHLRSQCNDLINEIVDKDAMILGLGSELKRSFDEEIDAAERNSQVK